jgi:rhamnulokinase
MSDKNQSRGGARRVVAVDLGAESCRVSSIDWDGRQGRLETVHRFRNAPTSVEGQLYWDMERIRKGVEEGLALCARKSEQPIDSIGVDGWAVDYVWLDSQSRPLRDPFCYRDPRTENSQAALYKKIAPERVYSLTGVQLIRINTLYQMYSDVLTKQATGQVWLNLPEYILHSLGGEAVAEHTNVANTQMTEAGGERWCAEVLDAAGLDRNTFPKIVPPGTLLGTLQGSLAELPQYRGTKIIAPACHDTACAVAGIGAEGDDWAFVSSGTWSLVGKLLPAPCTNKGAQQHNFSNECGIGGSIRFLKNLNGMWLIEECLRHWQKQNAEWKLAELIGACGMVAAPAYTFPVDDAELMLSQNMPDRINSVLRKCGHAELSTHPGMAPQFANLIFHSLAQRYAEVLQQVREITGQEIRRIFIVGGGSRNEYLNELVRRRCGVEVLRGPVESSTIGNAAIQMAVLDGSVGASCGVRADCVAEWSRALASAA